MIRYKCGSCGTELESDTSMGGQQDVCPICQHVNTVPLPGPPGAGGATDPQLQELMRQSRGGSQQRKPVGAGAGGGEKSNPLGWLWFILIFGVGNIILYKTTGWLIIPIRR